ncbi:EcsC family protein [Chryseolinea sp. T2]|uniref:EcsC family protein n=1 Tax=Chryseolinea sp. T2 TaxID=3129255 RepID=UPI003FCEBA9E
MDLSKLLQLVPGIGAAVGTVVNYRLTRRLGETAKNAYRMRWLGKIVHDRG